LGDANQVVPLLEKLFKGWNFMGLDSRGHLGGLAIGWHSKSIQVINSWGFESGLGIKVFVEDLGRYFLVLNVYGPSQDRVPFWDSLLNKSFLKVEDLIMGGDLNFSLGSAESWGQRAHPDALTEYFRHKLGEVRLLDITPIILRPTWRNKCVGEDFIAKRIDRFLLSEPLVESPLIFRQWVGSGGESDHHPIFLEVAGRPKKPASPFKFNSSWLQEEDFLNLVKEIWVPIGQEDRVVVQFAQNLKRLKKAIVEWDKRKKQNDEQELINIEASSSDIL
jgi:hypothetical protein